MLPVNSNSIASKTLVLPNPLGPSNVKSDESPKSRLIFLKALKLEISILDICHFIANQLLDYIIGVNLAEFLYCSINVCKVDFGHCFLNL